MYSFPLFFMDYLVYQSTWNYCMYNVLSRKNSSGESVAIRLQLKEWGSAGPLATLQYETRIHKFALVGLWKSGAKSVQILVTADPFLSHMTEIEPKLKSRAIQKKKKTSRMREGVEYPKFPGL
jgi:hypothetical protein